MTQSTKQVRWTKDRIISLRLRNGHYALMQMIERPGLFAVFDIFREKDEWDDVSLSKANVLFTCCLVRKSLARSTVAIHKEIRPVDGLAYETTRISPNGGFRRLTLWEGTPNERTLLVLGTGNNSLRELVNIDGHIEEKLTPIPLDDYAKYEKYELTSLSGYPGFNERLYLCDVLGRNIDPLKELAFNRELDPVCKVYIDIISGKVRLAELGY